MAETYDAYVLVDSLVYLQNRSDIRIRVQLRLIARGIDVNKIFYGPDSSILCLFLIDSSVYPPTVFLDIFIQGKRPCDPVLGRLHILYCMHHAVHEPVGMRIGILKFHVMAEPEVASRICNGEHLFLDAHYPLFVQGVGFIRF